MSKKEKNTAALLSSATLRTHLRFFERAMLKWFAAHGRALPWRRSGISAYEVWVSEIMLQQTQVNRVVGYFQRFMKRFPRVQDLARATWEDFLPYYTGLGYYRRGRNMLLAAQKVVQDFGGVFPRDREALLQLPGVGEYTAAAILSFAYGEPHLAFDTNLQKVFGRYLYGDKKASVDQAQLEKFLQAKKGTLNAAIMDFANVVCVRRPKCDACPLRARCVYFSENGKREVQVSLQRDDFPASSAQIFLWLHKDHKEYYSADPDSFQVFRLPSPLNTREAIKKYFLDEFGLQLAVRPPHKRVHVDGVPTLFVNAQILLGAHEFGVFGPADAKAFNKQLLQKIL
ncbi:MAG: hypothetical protein A3F54_00530 [Candidatus Kerfeldbacteria bacterium RIFCSPHIGHO2_12_FULL_48_17]|uniref:Adenine DNA glycosylase n=1 Tax=Candidatus Kerfeldbacteria bacterium RIFCSPHIGHO2_12_FULL_48_17 TaxID=1798542 RepID=A0A1G2B6R7_9BACT|nr:MAG: hypothetical protein A3F54_00530 [Candidatus Kerfeldbacteria bacterium RIFCSPHIGHO2_12_FULL_48_17]